MTTQVLGRDPFLAGGGAADPLPPIIEPTPALPEQAPRRARRRQTTTPAGVAPAAPEQPISSEAGVPSSAEQLDALELKDGVDPYGMEEAYAERAGRLLERLYRDYFRVHTENVEVVPPSGRAILVANRAGTLPYDSLMLATALAVEHPRQRRLRPLIEDELWHLPFLGVFLRRIGFTRAQQDNAERLLRAEQVIAVFPEGSQGMSKLYRERYRLRRFGRGGFVKLAMRTQSPIIPVAIVGAEECHPLIGKVNRFARSLGVPYVPITPTFPWLGPLGLLPVPSKWRILLGEPVDVSAYAADAAEDQVLVTRLSEQVRQTIQGMLDRALAERRGSLLS